MFSTNNKISVRQLQTLLILDIFGMGITTLPRKMAEISQQDGWISLILGTLLACFFAFLITSLCILFPKEGFVQYSRRLLSYPIGTLLSLGLVVKIIVSLSMELRIFSEIIKQIILFETPIWLISICMLMVGSYAASKGYEARGRISEILIFVVFIPLVFVFLIAVTDVDFTNLKPILASDKGNLFKGALSCGFSFSAIEFVLLAYPYLNKNKEKAGKRIIFSVLCAGLILSVITALTISRFGIFDMVHQMWPVLEIMDTIDLPGSFLERQDALIMSFWIIAIFVIINAGMFFSSLLLKNITEKGTHTFFILISMVIVYIISFIPKNIAELYYFMDKLNNYFGWIYTFLVPVILLIAVKVRKIGGEKDEDTKIN